MKQVLFFLSFIFLSCSIGINEQTEDSLIATDAIATPAIATRAVDCEDQINDYSQCLIKFHTKDCDSVQKSLVDKEFKTTYYAESHKACGMENVLALCNFNDLNIHNVFHNSVKNRTDKIFKECGIQ